MSGTFRAFRIHRAEDRITAAFEQLTIDDLSAGEVVVRVEWSSINFKDALAATGGGAVLRSFPLVGGIDLAGSVTESADARFAAGDRVLVCGSGLSETRDGGYSEYARLAADSIVRLPAGLTPREAMIIGTAGLSAALAIDRLQSNGLAPGGGPVVVSGASGGVGSVAVNLLATLGYEPVAITGKPAAADYLKKLGAATILSRDEVTPGRKPLEAAEFAAGIDNAGGDALAWMLPRIRPGGAVASIGLAGSHRLETTVMPFILRGIALLGINSVKLDPDYRDRIWARLGSDWKPQALERIVEREVAFDDLPDAFGDFMDGRVTGRRIVAVAPADEP